MNHYDEFYEANWEQELGILYPAQQQQDILDGYYMLKDTKGKPEGAKYCFLPYVHILAEKKCPAIAKLGTMIEDDNTFKSVNKLSEMYQYVKKASETQTWVLWSDVIAVRHDAIRSGKYKPDSYKEPIDIGLLQDAIARHYLKYLVSNDIDEESGYSHLAHIIANILICIAQLKEGENNDF